MWCLACGQGANPAPTRSAVQATDSGAAASPPIVSSQTSPPLVLFLGDSLTAGYGLEEGQAYPALVAAELEKTGRRVRVVNAGVSGDTTAGGLARLDWLLRQKPRVAVVALGANDGLRGLALEATENNLRQILLRLQAAGVQPLLAGMLIPPNYGPDYAAKFAGLFPKLSQELRVPLIPFLLEGVAAEPELNQADGIHPTAQGQVIVARTVLSHLEPLLAR